MPVSRADTADMLLNRQALDALINRLRRWEKSNRVYQEMCRAADARVASRPVA